ncbi:MAG: hypothetical protein KDA24_11395, partial [Deltaproteobacteria bacterium]|nr:hypothetical protein [Deltaproteobacteria bacterium]
VTTGAAATAAAVVAAPAAIAATVASAPLVAAAVPVGVAAFLVRRALRKRSGDTTAGDAPPRGDEPTDGD